MVNLSASSWACVTATGIAALVALFAVLACLVVALVLQRGKLRAARRTIDAQREALGRASRLAVAGELTAAIAHEINQPLGAILTNADIADLMLDSERDRRDELRAILANIRRDDLRACGVIQRLRALLGHHQVERKEFELNSVVCELEAIMGAEARRRGISLEFRLAPESLASVGDPVQIQQVLINLVLNAMDAVAAAPRERRVVAICTARSDRRALVAVRDRGHGIAREHRAKLFESFFSTKPDGMGLGLSITRSIVDAHGGRIQVESTPGQDTVFQVELPLNDAGPAAARRACKPALQRAEAFQ